MEIREDVKAAKEEAGRSEMGRRWSIILTDLEKLDALVTYWVEPRARDTSSEELPPPVNPDDD
jgi:hypothetical protein